MIGRRARRKDPAERLDYEVAVPCTLVQRDRWKRAAERGGVSCAEFMRRSLDQAADDVLIEPLEADS